MKNIKKFIVFCLAVMMVVGSVYTVHAGEMSGVPTQSSNSYSRNYARAIQVMLLNYNSTTRSCITQSGGADGTDGSGTVRGVTAFQQSRGIDDDGICGAATWRNFRNTLIRNGTSGQYAMYRGQTPYYTNMNNMRQVNVSGGLWSCFYITTWHSVG